MMPKIRTIDKAYELLKLEDPDTAISKHAFTNLVKDGTIPSQKSGVKRLVDAELAIEIIKEHFSAKGGDTHEC